LARDANTIFTVETARSFWGDPAYTANALAKLEEKGWLHRLERGTYMLIPLEAGPEREWSESALVIASHLIQPSAVAYWSALHYWMLTEQVPRTVFVQSTSRKHHREKDVLGIRFRFITVVEAKFFGMTKQSVGGQQIRVTDREKTMVDAVDRPDLSGGAAQLAQALRAGWETLDWLHLDDYLERWPTRSPFKRLGYLIEMLDLPIPEREERLARWRRSLSTGIVLLEPGRDSRKGRVVTRWRLRVNVEEIWRSESRGP
jgi:predicted transcriptional regulator of viral defense system